MFARSIVVVGFLAILTGCPSLEPQIPRAETTALIEAWFRDEGAPAGFNTFDKGQEKSVKVDKVYSYGQSSESYAEIELTNLRIRKNGVESTYNGRAKVHLRKAASGQWQVRMMSLLDGDHVKELFYPENHNPDPPGGSAATSGAPNSETPAPADSVPATAPTTSPTTPASGTTNS